MDTLFMTADEVAKEMNVSKAYAYKVILPFFKDRKIGDISSRDVVTWQNELLSAEQDNGEPYSQNYLKTVHNQLSAIFNHAVKHYGLPKNPAMLAGNMGKEEKVEMQFWTQEEYRKFSEAIMDKPLAYYAFEVLYWTGIREGSGPYTGRF